MSAHTPGPWVVGEFDESLGYDRMTASIRVGPLTLYGSDYGQRWMEPISNEARQRMEADARLIAAAPKLLAALLPFARATLTPTGAVVGLMREDFERAAAAIEEATVEPIVQAKARE